MNPHWILRVLARIESTDDWPVAAAIVFALGAVLALAVTGQL